MLLRRTPFVACRSPQRSEPAHQHRRGRVVVTRRLCPCGNEARNHKGPPRCTPCCEKRVRETQQRYHDRKTGSCQRGYDEPDCLWCGKSNQPRQYEVRGPKKFCSDRCRSNYGNANRLVRKRLERKCPCGAEPHNSRGIPRCRACRKESQETLARERSLRPYGITVNDYDAMLERQGGRCAICGTADPGRSSDVFAVDHCHETGQVRGLLCYKCNTGLGMFRDDPRQLVTALQYLGANIRGPIAWWAKEAS